MRVELNPRSWCFVAQSLRRQFRELAPGVLPVLFVQWVSLCSNGGHALGRSRSVTGWVLRRPPCPAWRTVSQGCRCIRGWQAPLPSTLRGPRLGQHDGGLPAVLPSKELPHDSNRIQCRLSMSLLDLSRESDIRVWTSLWICQTIPNSAPPNSAHRCSRTSHWAMPLRPSGYEPETAPRSRITLLETRQTQTKTHRISPPAARPSGRHS